MIGELLLFIILMPLALLIGVTMVIALLVALGSLE